VLFSLAGSALTCSAAHLASYLKTKAVLSLYSEVINVSTRTYPDSKLLFAGALQRINNFFKHDSKSNRLCSAGIAEVHKNDDTAWTETKKLLLFVGTEFNYRAAEFLSSLPTFLRRKRIYGMSFLSIYSQ
jgi:hypothetical protein